jgi:hypothetical protein
MLIKSNDPFSILPSTLQCSCQGGVEVNCIVRSTAVDHYSKTKLPYIKVKFTVILNVYRSHVSLDSTIATLLPFLVHTPQRNNLTTSDHGGHLL